MHDAGGSDAATPSISRRRLLLAALGVSVAACTQSAPWDGSGAPSDAAVPAWPTTTALRRSRLDLTAHRLVEAKDPCPVFDGSDWHLFGSGWAAHDERCQLVHGRAARVDGPYRMSERAIVHDIPGSSVAAPGVVFDGTSFHMFVQTDFARRGGTIEHLTSVNGTTVEHRGTAVASDASAGEDCLYDAQPALIGDRRFLVYAAARRVGQTSIHLAESLSSSWTGPWRRHGPVLSQAAVPFHNQVGVRGYEWGLEGPQLSVLPHGGILMTAVCFLAGRPRGTRQRMFLAVAPNPTGPYRVLGVPLQPSAGEWDGGENGHGGAVILGDTLTLLYQGRRSAHDHWGYGVAQFALP